MELHAAQWLIKFYSTSQRLIVLKRNSTKKCAKVKLTFFVLYFLGTLSEYPDGLSSIIRFFDSTLSSGVKLTRKRVLISTARHQLFSHFRLDFGPVPFSDGCLALIVYQNADRLCFHNYRNYRAVTSGPCSIGDGNMHGNGPF